MLDEYSITIEHHRYFASIHKTHFDKYMSLHLIIQAIIAHKGVSLSEQSATWTLDNKHESRTNKIKVLYKIKPSYSLLISIFPSIKGSQIIMTICETKGT